MSAIAGIFYFDGRPVEPGQIERMTAAMRARGPDGLTHWRGGHVALGQCMMRTTPESLEEFLPLANEDESLVLVMDGRVDNYDDLRRELLGRGAVLRTRADAELVLRAYEIWGEDCPDKIIGECVFFVWDARRQCLFAARDAVGTRHFYYHQASGWFAFASDCKGLLTLDGVDTTLDDDRIFDLLVPEFEREDPVRTIHAAIKRLPAGHHMMVGNGRVVVGRYWWPDRLTPNQFGSMQECADGYREHLKQAVKARVRSIKPIGATLSGGLDSSSIVAMIGTYFRSQLVAPLKTFSLVRQDRSLCTDWGSLRHLLEDPWYDATVITPQAADAVAASFIDWAVAQNEPLAMAGYFNSIFYNAAHDSGCSVMLDGMAADLHFYAQYASWCRAVDAKDVSLQRFVEEAYRFHGIDPPGWVSKLTRRAWRLTPEFFKNTFRELRGYFKFHRYGHQTYPGNLFAFLKDDFVQDRLQERIGHQVAQVKNQRDKSDLVLHAEKFMTGNLPFAHEFDGLMAFDLGVEPRSPFSDRRLIEFAVQMPIRAKLTAGAYKQTLRTAMEGVLPEQTRLRSAVGGNPGRDFYERLMSEFILNGGCFAERSLSRYLGRRQLVQKDNMGVDESFDTRYNLSSAIVFEAWLMSKIGLNRD